MFYGESKSARGAPNPLADLNRGVQIRGGSKSAVIPVVIGAFGSVRKKMTPAKSPKHQDTRSPKVCPPRNYSYTKSLSIK